MNTGEAREASEVKDTTKPIDTLVADAGSSVPDPSNEEGADKPLALDSASSVAKSTLFGVLTFAGLIACGVGFYSISLSDGSGGSGIMILIGIPFVVVGLVVAIPGLIGFTRATRSSSPTELGAIVLITLSCLALPKIFVPFWIIVFLARRYRS